MSNLVKYGSYDLDQAEKEAAGGQGGEFMKLAVGKNEVRFLPPPIGKKSPFRVVWTHSIKVPTQQYPVMFPCPKSEASKPCPACEQAERLKAAGDKASYDAAGQFIPRRRVYANVIDMADPESGVKILSFGKQIHDALIELRKNEDWGGDFTNPESGFNIIITRKGTGVNDTEYKVSPRGKTPLNNFELIDKQHDLERYAKVLSPQEIREKIAGKSQQQGGGGGQQRASTSAAPGGTIIDAKLEEFGDVPF